MSRAKRNLGETHEPLAPLTAEERVAFEAQWAAWEAEVAATPSRKALANVLAITGYALLFVVQAAVAGVLVYAGACLLGTFAACAAILAAGCVLWCAVALPIIGGGWVSRWLWQRIRRRGQ